MDENRLSGRTQEIAAGHGLELRQRIGAGGMGEVFLAKRRGAAGFERQVVVKRLSPSLTGDPQFSQALVKEATIMVRLSHPNVVQVQDLIFDSGEYLMVLEYVDGASLRKILAHASRADLKPPVGFALCVARDVLRALEYAHALCDDNGQSRPVIHCDVTPENVLVSRHGEVKLTDFGIAKVAHTTALTGEGQIRGKFRYVAPEQVDAGKITTATDIYSAGLVLYEMITLEFARRGADTIALVSEALRSTALELPAETQVEIPPVGRPELDAVLRAATAPAPADRPNAGEMARAVERVAAQMDLDLSAARAVTPYVLPLYGREDFLVSTKSESTGQSGQSGTQPTRRTAPGNRTTAPRRKPVVLVVDDSDLVCELLSRTLGRFGFQVSFVQSGGAALDWLAANECDAMLVDLNMPDLSGLELTSFVRSNPDISDLPIILLTSETDSARAVTGLGVGADDFVRKGVTEAEIAARLHAVMRRSRVG